MFNVGRVVFDIQWRSKYVRIVWERERRESYRERELSEWEREWDKEPSYLLTMESPVQKQKFLISIERGKDLEKQRQQKKEEKERKCE